MPVVTDPEDFGFADFLNRGRQPKDIPPGVFPTVAEWQNMKYIEKDSTHVNLLKAVRAGALWEIPMNELAPCLSDAQKEEFLDPDNGIVNVTAGVNGLVNTWMKRILGIPRNDRSHHTVIVRRFETDDDQLTVRAFIAKTVPVGSSAIHRNGNQHATY